MPPSRRHLRHISALPLKADMRESPRDVRSVGRHEVDVLCELDDRRDAAAAPPSSVINSRRLMPDMGLPPPSRSDLRQLPTPGVTRPARLACHGTLPSG